jgi:hypothetical protein
MKIGDIEVRKIPPALSIECDNGCSAKATHYFNDAPFCAECLHEAQQMQWEKDGNFFETIDGERVHYKVVKRFTVIVPL